LLIGDILWIDFSQDFGGGTWDAENLHGIAVAAVRTNRCQQIIITEVFLCEALIFLSLAGK